MVCTSAPQCRLNQSCAQCHKFSTAKDYKRFATDHYLASMMSTPTVQAVTPTGCPSNVAHRAKPKSICETITTATALNTNCQISKHKVRKHTCLTSTPARRCRRDRITNKPLCKMIHHCQIIEPQKKSDKNIQTLQDRSAIPKLAQIPEQRAT